MNRETWQPALNSEQPSVLLAPDCFVRDATRQRDIHVFDPRGGNNFNEWFRDVLERILLTASTGDLQRHAVWLPPDACSASRVALLADFNISVIVGYRDAAFPFELLTGPVDIAHAIVPTSMDLSLLSSFGYAAGRSPELWACGGWQTVAIRAQAPPVDQERADVAASLGLGASFVLEASAPPEEEEEAEESKPLPQRVWLVQSGVAGAERTFLSVCQSNEEAERLAAAIDRYAEARRVLLEEHRLLADELRLIGEPAKIQSFELE